MKKELSKVCHFLMVPFTGLGLYNGFRGNRWLKNRIQIFEQFVIPSLLTQTSKNFIIWIAWRYEEKSNKIVQDFQKRLNLIKELKFVYTFSGCPFYDDKYPDDIAKERLLTALHGSMGELLNVMGECDEVLMTIQPSDDCYRKDFVEGMQNVLKDDKLQAAGFSRGYICNYFTKEVRENNPKTNPPFVTIKFPREVFIDPLKHFEYTAIKEDVGKYKKGTACPSHEFYPNVFGDKYGIINKRGFLVGTHSDNISTTYKHPYAGEIVSPETLKDFGLFEVEPLKIKYSIRKRLLKALPYKVQRKLRYWWGEFFWNKIYEFLRG